MSIEPRPAADRSGPQRLPRALRTRRKGGLAVLAAALGVLGAIVGVLWLLPTDTGEPLSAVSAAPPAPVRRVAPPVVVAVPEPAPVEAPTDEAPNPFREPDKAMLSAHRQWFSVRVLDSSGGEVPDATVLAVDCEGFGYDPIQKLFMAAPGRCLLEATRPQGALFSRSEPTAVALSAQSPPTSVDIHMPSVRTGGIGVRFLPIKTGMRVVQVVDGGPAMEAGLEVGDVIISVDGEAVDGLDQQEFVRRMTGPEGSSVEFEILYQDPHAPADDGVVEQVRVERQYLEG